MEKCSKCGETNNFHYNYDYSKAERPVLDILCNKCGNLFKPSLYIQLGLKLSGDIPTAEEFIPDNNYFFVENQHFGTISCLDKEDVKKLLIEFAKLHVEAALKTAYSNTGFVETTSEKLNSEEYKPFITDEDGKLWTISDKDSILNAYPLTNIK